MFDILYHRDYYKDINKIKDRDTLELLESAIEELSRRGNNIGMPLQKKLKYDLKGRYELIPKQWRIFYCCRDNILFVIGFVYKKKSMQIPKKIKKRALRFLKELKT
ncbi:MAG: type II toxin-antitoxin system RelE/ParE family toxin [bacterium]